MNKAISSSKLTALVRSRIYSRGQTLMEYGLIIALVSIVAMALLMNLGQQSKSVYTNLTSTIATSIASH